MVMMNQVGCGGFLPFLTNLNFLFKRPNVKNSIEYLEAEHTTEFYEISQFVCTHAFLTAQRHA